MAVAYTGEAVMAHMYKAGLDMHTETAKYIFSKNDVTTEERVVAKTFNFCLIYGGGAATAQSTLQTDANMHLPIQEVQELRLKWFDMYEYYKEWHNMHKKQMNIYGYCDVETALGRKVRAYRLTDSLNIPIQGSSVEVTKSSLAILKRKHKDAIIINTIHDSNLLMAKEDEAKDWGQALSDAMVEGWQYVIEDLADPDIPMPGGYEYGPVWKWHGITPWTDMPSVAPSGPFKPLSTSWPMFTSPPNWRNPTPITVLGLWQRTLANFPGRRRRLICRPSKPINWPRGRIFKPMAVWALLGKRIVTCISSEPGPWGWRSAGHFTGKIV